MLYRYIFYITLSLFSFSLCANDAHQFYVGPEIYHVHRTKAGGARQDGTIFGLRGGYDRIKHNTFYIGLEGLYGKGTLDGKSATKNTLRSTFTDRMIEGRLGYTVGYHFPIKQQCYPFLFSPFAGVGRFEEGNDYKGSTPLHIHTKTKFDYIVGGFLSRVSLTAQWSLGVNFKLRYMWDPKCKISHDPEYDDFTLLIKNRYHYRTEFPLTYKTDLLMQQAWVSLVPFFEYRGYGEHANFPYDYSDTKLQLYGVTLKMMYCF